MNNIASRVFYNQKTGNLRTGWKAARNTAAVALGVFLLAHANASFGQKAATLRGNIYDLIKSGFVRDGDTIFFHNQKVMGAAIIRIYDRPGRESLIGQFGGTIPVGCDGFFKFSRGDAITVTTVYKGDKVIKGVYYQTDFGSKGRQSLSMTSTDGVAYSIPMNAIISITLGK